MRVGAYIIARRYTYRRAWEALVAALPPRVACRTMVGLLELAHERACEADLADALERALAAHALPDLAALRERFAPAQAAVPDVTVTLPALATYDTLRETGLAGDVSATEALA